VIGSPYTALPKDLYEGSWDLIMLKFFLFSSPPTADCLSSCLSNERKETHPSANLDPGAIDVCVGVVGRGFEFRSRVQGRGKWQL
jgi:hypothetical protein